jgi:hypothetical protein
MITRGFEARIRRVEQTDVDIPVQVVLSYDAGTDPYAVTATFLARTDEDGTEEDRVWDFARDLLSKGAHSRFKVGRGDVRFRHYPQSPDGPIVLMCMRSPHGHADVSFPQDEVISFLEDTEDLYAEATEDCMPAVDRFLKELLG